GLAGLALVAHLVDDFWRRPDEGDVALFANLGEVGVFRQESVSGMDRIGAADFRGGDDVGDVQVAFRRRRRPNADRLVGEPHVHGATVGGGIHRDALNTELTAGADDPHRDLTSVGDKYLVEHWVPT